MSIKFKLIIGALALLVSFAAGRFLAPTKTVTEIKTVEVEKKQTDVKEKKHEKTTKKEIDRPDGTREITTVVTDDDSTNTTTKQSDTVAMENIRTTERSESKLTLSAIGGVHVSSSPQLAYGGMIQKEVLGPIGIGIWGLNNGTVGVSVGLSF